MSWRDAKFGEDRCRTLERDGGQTSPPFVLEPKVFYGSWLCKKSAAWKIDRTDLSSDRIYRHALTAKMTPAQVAEAQRLAREWKPDQK